MTKEFDFEKGRDYYLDNGAIILTERYLKRRGKCCGSGCKNCPYWPQYTKDNTILKEEKK